MQESPQGTQSAPVFRCHLRCGMQVVIERIEGVRSAGLTWHLPIGTSGDPIGAQGDGESVMLSELVLRGSGGLGSREFSDAMDNLGASRRCTATGTTTVISSTSLGSRMGAVLRLLVGVVRHPLIAEEAIEPVRALAIAAIDGLDDSPAYVASLNMHLRALPFPYNRSGMGTIEGLNSLSRDGLHGAWFRRCLPGAPGDPRSIGGSLLAVAGDVDPSEIVGLLEDLLGDWTGVGPDPSPAGPPERGVVFKELPTNQTHMCLGFDAPRATDPDRVAFRLMTEILGGGMSSRLFTEVREKRSLCYSVGAGMSAGRRFGLLSISAGSTNERARETLACIDTEVHRLRSGVSAEEFGRAKVKLKSSLVMRGESTAARAASISQDTAALGRPRSLSEVAGELDRVQFEEFNLYLAAKLTDDWLKNRTLSVVGPRPLADRLDE